MNPSKIILDVYDIITFPLAVVGMLFYFLIETPIFIGRMKGHAVLAKVAYEADQEEPTDEE